MTEKAFDLTHSRGNHLKIETREINNIIILDIEGEIRRSWEETTTLHQHVKNYLKEGKRNFILNLNKVEFMDSYGVGELLACLKSIHDLGGRLKLLKLPPRIMLLFKITGLVRIFEIFDDEEEAIKSFSN